MACAVRQEPATTRPGRSGEKWLSPAAPDLEDPQDPIPTPEPLDRLRAAVGSAEGARETWNPLLCPAAEVEARRRGALALGPAKREGGTTWKGDSPLAVRPGPVYTGGVSSIFPIPSALRVLVHRVPRARRAETLPVRDPAEGLPERAALNGGRRFR